MKNIIVLFSFILTISFGLFLNTLPFSNKVEQEIAEKVFWTKKFHHEKENKNYDFIIIGDSRSLRGINPDLMKELGNGYNFSFPQAGLNSTYLKEAIKLLKKQGRLLISVTPFSFTDLAFENEKMHEFRNISFDDFLIQSKKSYLRMLSSINFMKFSNEEPKLQKTFFENGFVATRPKEVDVISGVNSYIKNFRKEKYQIEKVKTFLKSLDMIKDKREIIFFRMPVFEQVKSVENQLGKFNEEVFKNQVIERHYRWVDIPSWSEYETYDGSHLDIRSAEAFSKNLERYIVNGK